MVKLTRSKSVPVKKSTSVKKDTEVSSRVSQKEEKKPKKKVTNTSKKVERQREKAVIAIQKEIVSPQNHKVTIVDKTAKLPKHIETPVPALRSPRTPAVLSSFRFPLLPEKHLGTVSKIAGVFLVISGVFLSFLNLYASSDVYARLPFLSGLANIIGSKNGTVVIPTSVVVKEVVPKNAETVKPESRIAIESSQPLQGAIPISIVVPYATEVTLILENISEHTLVVLGEASRVDATTWKFDLETTDYEDGEYRVRTVVKNSEGTYESTDKTTYVIKNQSNDTSTSEADDVTSEKTQESDFTISTSTTPEENIPVSATVEDSLMSNVLIEESDELSSLHSKLFKISVLDATEVKVYARNTKTLALTYIGLARQKDPQTWYVEWKTDKVREGSYTVLAKAKIKDEVSESRKITVSVTNTGDAGETLTNSSTSISLSSAALKPEITLTFEKSAPFSGSVTMSVTSQDLSWVELYAQPKTSLIPFFLGLATEKEPNIWKFTWETKQTPNGDYVVYARGKTMYGFVEGNQETVSILNGVVSDFSESEEKKLDTFIDAKNALTKKVEDTDFEHETGSSSVLEPEDQAYVQPVVAFLSEISLENDAEEEVKALLLSFRNSLDEKLTSLSLAERANDQVKIEASLNEIESLKQDTIAKVPKTIPNDEVLRIEGYVYQIISIQQDVTISNERILKERIGDAITQDSDKDEISDYDEINLYQTNPFVADTDGDSFIDGLEVKGGFDPHNSDAEALVAYESPKETGAVRKDLLLVDSITALHTDVDTEETKAIPHSQKAVISGKGLPNSFVTIYIYSTPLVATVRTDAEGKWSYILDKTLEDGNHEIFVGITDNNGRIVAKSNPLSFIKAGEAFTTDQNVTEAKEEKPAETVDGARTIVFLLGSVLVVTLGLILIVLGFHISRRQLLTGQTTVTVG